MGLEIPQTTAKSPKISISGSTLEWVERPNTCNFIFWLIYWFLQWKECRLHLWITGRTVSQCLCWVVVGLCGPRLGLRPCFNSFPLLFHINSHSMLTSVSWVTPTVPWTFTNCPQGASTFRTSCSTKVSANVGAHVDPIVVPCGTPSDPSINVIQSLEKLYHP